MVIKAMDKRDYVFQYLSALQYKSGLVPREVSVATEIVLKVMLFQTAREKIKREETKRQFDPMKEWKKPEVLAEIRDNLGMSSAVFRNYVTSLKKKGFFTGYKVSDEFIPKEETTTITITYEGY